MTYYVKLFNNIAGFSATYKDENNADQTVYIAGGSAVTAVPFQVLGLTGVVRAHDAGNLKVYSDSDAEDELTDIPNSPVGQPGTATTTVAGLVKQSAAIADFAGADAAALVTELNAALAKLRTAGLVAPNA